MWTTKNRGRYDRSQLRYPSDLTNDEWSHIETLISPAKRGGNRRHVDVREVMNGIMYVLSTGCQWRAIPKDLSPQLRHGRSLGATRRLQFRRRANALCASSVMGGNALDALRDQIAGRRSTDIAKRKHADHPLVLVDHWQSTDLQSLHVPHCLAEIIVLPAAMNARSHHVARHGAARIKAILRQPFTDNIAVSDHADQLVVLSNRNCADVMLTHQFREVYDGSIRTDPIDSLVHRVFDFHGGPPLLEFGCT